MKVEDIRKLYEDDDRFREYMEGYSKKERKTVEECFMHKMVDGVAEQYKNTKKPVFAKTDIVAGCGSVNVEMGECK